LIGHSPLRQMKLNSNTQYFIKDYANKKNYPEDLAQTIERAKSVKIDKINDNSRNN